MPWRRTWHPSAPTWTGAVPGRITTKEVDPDKEIHQVLERTTKLGQRTSAMDWRFEPTETGTKVTWRLKGEHELVDKVWFALKGIRFNEGIQQMYRSGLDGLEKVVFDSMKAYDIKVAGIKEHGGGFYLSSTARCSREELPQQLERLYQGITQFMGRRNIGSAGMPFTVYHATDSINGLLNISAAIPIKERVETPIDGPIVCAYMEPTTAVKTILTGDYANLQKAYASTENYISEQHLIKNTDRSPFEIYANDPGLFPNPAHWITEIYIPVFRDLRSNHDIIKPQ